MYDIVKPSIYLDYTVNSLLEKGNKILLAFSKSDSEHKNVYISKFRNKTPCCKTWVIYVDCDWFLCSVISLV